MDGNLSETSANVQDTGYFKEAVCIDAMRVYDSCSEQQCARYIHSPYHFFLANYLIYYVP